MSAFPRTLLAIVNAAQQELGLPQSASIAGNTDPATLQMLGLAQKTGEEMRDMHEEGWTSLHTEFDVPVSPPLTFTGNTTAGSATLTGFSSTTGIIAGAMAVSDTQGALISGPGAVPTASRVVSITSTTVTLNMQASASVTGDTFKFAQDTYTLPSDFRYYSNRTFWDRTNRWELIGPDSPQMDQWHRSGIIAYGPRRHFRQIGRLTSVNPTWRLWPPPFEIANALQLAFEYLSSDWICVQGGAVSPPSPPTYAAVWANDTDIPCLDDRAIIDGIKWRYWKAKGFAFEDDRNDWIDLVNRLIARDGAAPTLRLARHAVPFLLTGRNTQDGFFPGPTDANMS
jgi:hypothetical protein